MIILFSTVNILVQFLQMRTAKFDTTEQGQESTLSHAKVINLYSVHFSTATKPCNELDVSMRGTEVQKDKYTLTCVFYQRDPILKITKASASKMFPEESRISQSYIFFCKSDCFALWNVLQGL